MAGLNAAEYACGARLAAGHRASAREALTVSVGGSIANLLPIPARSSFATMRWSRAERASPPRSAALSRWLSPGWRHRGRGRCDRRDCQSGTGCSGRDPRPRHARHVRVDRASPPRTERVDKILAALLLVEVATVGLDIGRYWLVLAALGAHPNVMRTMPLVSANVITAAMLIFPGGLDAGSALRRAQHRRPPSCGNRNPASALDRVTFDVRGPQARRSAHAPRPDAREADTGHPKPSGSSVVMRRFRRSSPGRQAHPDALAAPMKAVPGHEAAQARRARFPGALAGLRAPLRAEGSLGRPVVGPQDGDLLLLHGADRVAGLGDAAVVDRLDRGRDRQHREVHRRACRQEGLSSSLLAGAPRGDAHRPGRGVHLTVLTVLAAACTTCSLSSSVAWKSPSSNAKSSTRSLGRAELIAPPLAGVGTKLVGRRARNPTDVSGVVPSAAVPAACSTVACSAPARRERRDSGVSNTGTAVTKTCTKDSPRCRPPRAGGVRFLELMQDGQDHRLVGCPELQRVVERRHVGEVESPESDEGPRRRRVEQQRARIHDHDLDAAVLHELFPIGRVLAMVLGVRAGYLCMRDRGRRSR